MSLKKRYLWAHVTILAVALSFYLYATLMNFLFPNGYFHCVMHDVLHLYCPFCGGTRAFLALLHFDIPTLLLCNIAVPVAGVVALAFDLRALIRLCRGCEGPLIPPVLWQLAVIWFLLYTWVRNTLLLLGVDPTGELLPYWQGTSPLRAWGFLIIGLLLSAAFLVATDQLRVSRLQRWKRATDWVSCVLLVVLLCMLYLK